jgi:hypothetical protein
MDAPRVTIAGSYNKFLERLLESREIFIRHGAQVLRPRATRRAQADAARSGDWVRLEGDPADAASAHREMLAAIDQSDLLYVVNPGGYLGPAATANVAWAAKSGALIVLAEQAYEEVVAALADGVGDELYALELLKEWPRR